MRETGGPHRWKLRVEGGIGLHVTMFFSVIDFEPTRDIVVTNSGPLP